MQNKRALIIIVLIVAVLLLAVGYAAITKDLSIGGTIAAGANADNFKVHYQGTTGTISSTNTGATLSATTNEEHTATIEASGLDTAGQTVTAVFTIVNESDDLGADLTVETQNLSGTNVNYFEIVSTELGKTTLSAKGTGTADTTTVTVVLRLKTTPVDNVTASINVALKATATEV